MRRRIVVDVTPLAPGGQNGGAGLVAVSLIRQIARLAPEWDLVLLTSRSTHAELADLDNRNVQRVSVPEATLGEAAAEAGTSTFRQLARRGLQVLPAVARVQVKDRVWRLRTARNFGHVMDSVQADLLFCPLTVSQFWRPDTPLIATVYDLQHVAYPEFFSDDQRLSRDQHLRDVGRRAQRIVCISDFVRRTLLAHVDVPDERVVTVHLGLLHEVESGASHALEQHGLRRGGYLLYPANFWPHKNHRRLFDALRQIRERRPNADLKLVCTGSPNDAMDALRAYADDHIGTHTVLFPGYLSAADLQQLLDGCAAVIYPSLYEGFGLPVLEAMASGKPVLCSNVTSLPEIAGDAATYFDPTSAEEMAAAIESLIDHVPAIEQRVALGRERALAFGDGSDLARKYLQLFDGVLARV